MFCFFFHYLKRITPRSTSILNQELYLFHRAGLTKELIVRPAENRDFDGVSKLVHNIRTKKQLLQDLNAFLKSRKIEVNISEKEKKLYSFKNNISYFKYGVDIEAYVAECFGQVIAIAILKQEEVRLCFELVFLFY